MAALRKAARILLTRRLFPTLLRGLRVFFNHLIISINYYYVPSQAKGRSRRQLHTLRISALLLHTVHSVKPVAVSFAMGNKGMSRARTYDALAIFQLLYRLSYHAI